MADFATLRRSMVDGQVRTADVTDRPLIQAMLDVPRERFVPADQRELSYLDLGLVVGEGRRLLKPMVLAKMIQALELAVDQRVLDVGCTTGYAAALLSRLCNSVVALEEQPALASQARANLSGIGNVEVIEGALAAGHVAGAPYDAILVEGAVEFQPDSLCRQLSEGGRLVCILGVGPAAKATLYRRDGADISRHAIFDAAGVVLPGFAKPAAFAF
ncbi:protein-L-isoaspartate O-methyltransferase [Pseudorhodoplanes sp.]|uniref:protein-L-isoaspartate O-methyltransferase family protein n=1 Tax=Pseudorhodoplanes sp. TaxID=1934341 RepID=UPI002CC9C419|nr:protein-L-isoaspartate O-methyltransferase [Pseudorhodoplanes sp.]HWV53846.1 protein-L-isoaspartate O-methyltransferase [Pseudorhodoplanes sp.]